MAKKYFDNMPAVDSIALNKSLGQLSYPHKPDLMLQLMRQSKGGQIGVGNKAVIALRFDDGQDAFKTSVLQLLIDRGLPASYCLISEFSTKTGGLNTTWADIVSWNNNGIEIWCHSKDHLDYNGDDELYAQIVTAKETIESHNIKVQGFAQPGVTPVYNVTPYDGLGSLDGYMGLAGKLIYENYALSEAYWNGNYRVLSPSRFHGAGHLTISDGLSVAAATGAIDYAIQEGLGLELMVHPANLGGSGFSTIANLTTILDYIVTKRDAGLIEVLTPSGLMFADKSTNRHYLLNTGFEDVVAGAGVWALGDWTGKTIETEGGRTNPSYLKIANTTTTFPYARISNLVTKNMDGETFQFTGWFRSSGVGITIARVTIQSYPSNALLNLNEYVASNGSTWTKFNMAFTIPVGVAEIIVGVTRSSEDGIDWDDITIAKV